MDTRLARISGLLLTSAFLLAGCNDDSSSTTETAPPANSTPVTITSTNATTIARSVLAGDSATAYTGANPYASKAGLPSGNQDATYQRIFDLALAYTRLALDADSSAATSARTVTTNTLNCDVSGTMTLSSNDTNVIGVDDAGDSFTLTFNQCADATSVTSGSYTFTLNEKTGDPSLYPSSNWSVGVSFGMNLSSTYTFADGSSDTTTIKGGATLTDSYDQTTTVTSGSMQGSSIKSSWTWNSSDGSKETGTIEMANFNFANTQNASNSSYTTDIDFTLRASNIDGLGNNGSVTVNTNPIFRGLIDAATGNANPPTEGTMVITGGEGSTLTLVANSDGTVTLTVNNEPAQTYTWTELGGW
ncbi:MAG TPA: hypothetical protein VGE00_05340 [Gammaproteobacteria bacterium]